jgi:hypothetical protein
MPCRDACPASLEFTRGKKKKKKTTTPAGTHVITLPSIASIQHYPGHTHFVHPRII